VYSTLLLSCSRRKRNLCVLIGAIWRCPAAFNGGVEVGQTCIVLLVAPLLALLQRRSAPAAGRLVTAASVCVIAAGACWFVQRAAT
jgi:hypothetical protein